VTLQTSPNRIPPGDYVSPGFSILALDHLFPHMTVGNDHACHWPYLRREVEHPWYVDGRYPRCGFLSRDEAHVLFNNALRFRGRRALEIGCWKGWSTCHLLAAGVDLDVIDPVLEIEEFRQDVETAVGMVRSEFQIETMPALWAGKSAETVHRIGSDVRWSFVFIDGSHEPPAPLEDAAIVEQYAADDAVILLHDVVAPGVAEGLAYLRDRGWATAVYQTMQMIGVAWRGLARPVPHHPDPAVQWTVPSHLPGFPVVDLAGIFSDAQP
jgi:predicted O-methyltransferase YrrM